MVIKKSSPTPPHYLHRPPDAHTPSPLPLFHTSRLVTLLDPLTRTRGVGKNSVPRTTIGTPLPASPDIRHRHPAPDNHPFSKPPDICAGRMRRNSVMTTPRVRNLPFSTKTKVSAVAVDRSEARPDTRNTRDEMRDGMIDETGGARDATRCNQG